MTCHCSVASAWKMVTLAELPNDLDADAGIDEHEVVHGFRADSDAPARTYQIDIARLRSNVLHRRRTGFFIFNRSRVRPRHSANGAAST
jgi:hypothetical protein